MNNADSAIFIALGSNLAGNLGSSQDLLQSALGALSVSGVHPVWRSRWWTSQAWPNAADPPFINGVARVETELAPRPLLDVLHRVEARYGRVRGEANAPRTLDLDLIAYGREVRTSPIIPHPRAHERLFAIGPLAEIAPTWRHPVLGASAAALAAAATLGLDAHSISQSPEGSSFEVTDYDNGGPVLGFADLQSWRFHTDAKGLTIFQQSTAAVFTSSEGISDAKGNRWPVVYADFSGLWKPFLDEIAVSGALQTKSAWGLRSLEHASELMAGRSQLMSLKPSWIPWAQFRRVM